MRALCRWIFTVARELASPTTQRKLTAILCADVVGYSRLMGADEESTIETLTAYRKLLYSYIQQLLQWLRGVGRRQRCRYLAVALLLMGALLLPGGAAALKHGEPIRIGVLTTSWGTTPQVVGLRDGLVELGYREDEHFVIGVRFTSGDITKLSAAARELVGIGVDILFTVSSPAAIAAQRATENIPIVFTTVGDPVQSGLVESYARPGGNITGVADSNTALAPKRLEMFKLLIPRIRKVLFVYDSADPRSVATVEAYRGAGARLGITLVERAVRNEAEAKAAFATVENGQVDGLLSPLQLNWNIPGLVVETAGRKGIPSMFVGAFYLELGGLASYAPGYYASGRQAARLVEKIMRGVKPAEIPVEVNNDIEFAVNLKTAKALRIKIPPEVLYQAHRIFR